MDISFADYGNPFVNNHHTTSQRPRVEEERACACIYEFLFCRAGHKDASETGEQRVGGGEVGVGLGGERPEITHRSRESHLFKLLGNGLISIHIVPLR